MTPEYIAGFLDADGSIFISCNGMCVVDLTNTNKNQIESIAKRLGCGHVLEDSGKCGPVYRWRATSRVDVITVLQAVVPHLVRKRQQGYIVLAAAMLPRATRLVMKEAVSELNRRRTPVEALAPMKVYR